jgi:hypothetical protein
MVFLVEDFALRERAQIFLSSGYLAGSRLASNSRLDARLGGVAGRLSEEEMMGLKRLMRAMSL